MKHYVQLAVMTALMFIVMYVLMYAMVDRLENVFPNVNQFYMAGLMTAPMVLIEIVIMRAMYGNRRANEGTGQTGCRPKAAQRLALLLIRIPIDQSLVRPLSRLGP